MDALFWLYIIFVIVVFVKDDFKDEDKAPLPTPTIRFTDEDKAVASQENCNSAQQTLRRERARIESRMVEGELFK